MLKNYDILSSKELWMSSVHDQLEDVLNKLQIHVAVEEDFYDSIDHGELVRMLVALLCDQLGIEESVRNEALVAAGLHDIGKLKISENIYGRDKSALHVEEVRYMRMHARLGAEMLRECGYPEGVVSAVYHHHENYDGTGYPDNLSGEQIPYSSRLIHVCDSFAALISDRPYRKAFDMDTAMEMMIEDIKMYDVGIFMGFMKLYNSDRFTTAMDLSKLINSKHRYGETKIG